MRADPVSSGCRPGHQWGNLTIVHSTKVYSYFAFTGPGARAWRDV